MTAILHPNSRALLHQRIATKQAQQAQRRQHLADLAALIEHHDTELINLQAQLDRGVIACRPPNDDDASPAQSANAACSANPTTPSCPPTTTKQADHAP